MDGLRHLAQSAVTKPLRICFSASDPDCRLYFGAGPTPGIMVVVVGDIVAGFVRTAHRANKIKGTVEW